MNVNDNIRRSTGAFFAGLYLLLSQRSIRSAVPPRELVAQ
jgi:hypothetical protein